MSLPGHGPYLPDSWESKRRAEGGGGCGGPNGVVVRSSRPPVREERAKASRSERILEERLRLRARIENAEQSPSPAGSGRAYDRRALPSASGDSVA